MRAILLPLALLAACPALAAAADGVVNGSFEDGLEGWEEMVGATTGGGDTRPEIAVDEDVARTGDRSLRVTGSADAVRWPLFHQALDVPPGHRVSVRVAARCEGVARVGRQYANSNALLIFEDASGQRLGFHTSAVLSGDREWLDLAVDAIAPPGTAVARVGVFHSISGTAWFDDVRVETAPADVTDPAGRALAFDALAGHLRRTYPFWGLPGKPDADALFESHRQAALAAEDLATYAGALRGMLAELDDVHVWIDTPLGRIGTASPGPGAQFDVRAVLDRLDEKVVHGRNVLAGWIGEGDDRVGYLLVATFAKGDPEWDQVVGALDSLRSARALIVDVRPNGGGDETKARAIAATWADEPVVYAGQRFRDPTLPGLTGFGPVQQRRLERDPDARRFLGRVAVLSGPGCISSTEGFLLMCKALPRVTVVGQPSRGASGNPGAFEVFPTLSVWTSRWQSLDPDGRCIEGTGVPPDIEVEPAGPRGSADRDPVLDRALELLRE